MRALGFRTKLLILMMALVIGVTGSTLFVTQQRVQVTYARLFQDQFESEVHYFSERQETRLRSYKDRCLKLAKSGPLRAALRDSDIKKLYETIYLELDPARLGRLGNMDAATGNESLDLPPRPVPGEVFVRALDAEGKVIDPKDGRGGLPAGVERRRLAQQLDFLRQMIHKLDRQQVGYLDPDSDASNARLLEVIVTKIADAATGEIMGAIVLGFPLPDLGERALKRMSSIQSGIFFDNEIHRTTILHSTRPLVVKRIATELAVDAEASDFVMSFDGVKHRVFYRLLNPKSPLPPAYQVYLYSLESAARTERDLRWRILGFGAVALLAALAISPLLIHGLYRPIGDVVKGTTEIRRGNFAIQVPVRSRDQIGGLASAFNEMAKDLALKEKYHNVLNMVADKDVAAQLMSGEVNLGGEVRQVSILFCDIRDFTPLTEQMPPSEVIQLLNEHMTALTRVVYEYQGVVDKFVGDLIMAVFGAPSSYGNDVANAARCALRMMEERQKLNVSSRHRVQIGIGIASGQVLAGCMGSKDRLNYTVLGKRVNLASRLCGKAAPGQIIIDETTHESLKDVFRANAVPALDLKGFANGVNAYELIDLRTAPNPAVSIPVASKPS